MQIMPVNARGARSGQTVDAAIQIEQSQTSCNRPCSMSDAASAKTLSSLSGRNQGAAAVRRGMSSRTPATAAIATRRVLPVMAWVRMSGPLTVSFIRCICRLPSGTLICLRNSPPAQIGDSGGTTNAVGGNAIGECREL